MKKKIFKSNLSTLEKKKLIRKKQVQLLTYLEKVNPQFFFANKHKLVFFKKDIDNFLKKRNLQIQAMIHVHSTKHNTILTLTTMYGDTLAWASSGMFYKKSQRGLPLAAKLAAKKLANHAKRIKILVVGVQFNGLGRGINLVVDEIIKNKIKIKYLKDVTPISHNGCRPPKIRRNRKTHREAYFE